VHSREDNEASLHGGAQAKKGLLFAEVTRGPFWAQKTRKEKTALPDTKSGERQETVMKRHAFLRVTKFTAPLGALFLVLAGADYLFSFGSYGSNWATAYPNSTSYANASCQLCHGSSTSTLNGYGNAVRQAGTSVAAIQSIGNQNSDGDAGGSNNLAEINANAQPGWTSGINTVYTTAGANAGTATAPLAASVLLDPIAAPAPAPEINVTPLALEFGAVTVGSSQTGTTTVQNLGTANLIVSSVAVSANPDFTVDAMTPARPITVAAGTSANVVIRYTPSVDGDDSATLSIGSNDSNEASVSVTLHGTGTPPANVCDINVTPLSRNFGSVVVGQTATLAVSIGNTGTGPCSVSALAVTPAEFALHTSVPARPFTVQPSAAVQVQLNYAPVNQGADTGSLQVTSDDPDEGTVTVALSGTGSVATACNIQVSQLALNFGGVPLGSSATRSTTITNTGDANCTVNSVSVTGSSEFTINPVLPSLPLTLIPGDGVPVSVRYTPSGLGDDAGTLTTRTSDPDQPTLTVSLAGSGVATAPQCDIQVTPLSLEFASVAVGSTQTLSTAVSNAGQGQCSVSWQLGAGASVDFGLGLAANSISLAPGATVTIPVGYSPSGVGGDAGTLQIHSNDPSEAEVPVALAGRGFVATGSVDLAVVRFRVPEEFDLRASTGNNSSGDSDRSQRREFSRDEAQQAAITISVVVRNNGETAEPRLATVTGVQGGVEVYNQGLMVSAPADGRRGFSFSSFVPTTAGEIEWTLVIQDDVPAGSTAHATTEVRQRGGAGSGGEDRHRGEGGDSHE
jgi:hypothetical protein